MIGERSSWEASPTNCLIRWKLASMGSIAFLVITNPARAPKPVPMAIENAKAISNRSIASWFSSMDWLALTLPIVCPLSLFCRGKVMARIGGSPS